MLSRLFTTSFFVTLIAGIPAYFLAVQGLQSSTIALTQLLILVFLVSAVSVWLGARSNAPRQKPRKRAAPSVPSNAVRESGSVKWFNASKGFGFITRDSGDDIFVHFRSIRGEGHRILRDGQRVEFAVSQGDKGLQADDVVPR